MLRRALVSLTADRFPSVTFPQIRNKILQERGTMSCLVTIIMHLTTTIYSVECVSRAQKPAITSVTLKHQGIASSRTFYLNHINLTQRIEKKRNNEQLPLNINEQRLVLIDFLLNFHLFRYLIYFYKKETI